MTRVTVLPRLQLLCADTRGAFNSPVLQPTMECQLAKKPLCKQYHVKALDIPSTLSLQPAPKWHQLARTASESPGCQQPSRHSLSLAVKVLRC
jgi:hypothetical protein